jgi:hypothetical protein
MLLRTIYRAIAIHTDWPNLAVNRMRVAFLGFSYIRIVASHLKSSDLSPVPDMAKQAGVGKR